MARIGGQRTVKVDFAAISDSQRGLDDEEVGERSDTVDRLGIAGESRDPVPDERNGDFGVVDAVRVE